jgi:hypothetical protein
MLLQHYQTTRTSYMAIAAARLPNHLYLLHDQCRRDSTKLHVHAKWPMMPKHYQTTRICYKPMVPQHYQTTRNSYMTNDTAILPTRNCYMTIDAAILPNYT